MMQRLGSMGTTSAQGLLSRCMLVQGPRRHEGSQQRPRPSLHPSLPTEALMSLRRHS